AGFRCSSNQFTLLLRNPLYAGYVLIPAWRDEAEDIVKGVHEPLVDEAAYERVQRKRFAVPGPTAGRRKKIVPELPLRGHLRCPRSGVPLYGSASRSCTGARVWYYHGKGRGAVRYRAEAAHEAWAEYIEEVP